MTPQYEHDCSCCVFLGNSNGHDHYYCPQHGMATLIIRFGSIGQEYSSLPVMVVNQYGSDPRFAEYVLIYNKAKEKGLIT